MEICYLFGMVDFYEVLKRIFVKLDDDPLTDERKSFYDQARNALEQGLKESDASEVLSDAQRGELERVISAIEVEYSPERPNRTSRPLVVGQAYRMNSESRFRFVQKEFSNLLENIKSDVEFRRHPPPEPKIDEGPQFEMREGKLALAMVPISGGFNEKLQRRLHERLRSVVASSLPALVKLGNKFPELLSAAEEYNALLKP